MYFLYNILQLCWSLLEHILLVKCQNWNSVRNDIAFLTAVQLQNAAKTAFNEKIINNFTICRLQQNLVLIDMQISKFFSQKLIIQSQIRNLTVWNTMLIIWLTINSLNLQNFLVLILIRIECSENVLFIVSAIIYNTAATSNLVTVAQFFNHICKVFFDDLIQFDTE